VAVEMDWVRRWGTLAGLDVLDDPVNPFALEGKLDQVLGDGEGVVAVHDILDDRLAPVDVHGGRVQGPDDDIAGGPDGVERGRDELETNGESLDLGKEVGDVADVVGNPWGEGRGSQAVTTVGVAGGGCRLSDLDTRVCEDGETGTLVVGVAASGLGLSAEPVVAGGLVGVDDDFVSLTDVEEDGLDSDGLDRDQVGGDDLEGVAVKRDTNGIVNGHVDDAEEVLLAGGELDVEVLASGAGRVHVGSVDEDIVGRGTRAVLEETHEDLSIGISGGHVEPVVDCQWAQVNVPVVRGGAVDDQRTSDTVTVLRRVVRVVPCSTELGSLKAVGLGLTGGERALGDTVHTVLDGAAQLAETVPVNGSTVGLHVVVDGDLEVVSPVGPDERTGVLAVDEEALARVGSIR